MSSTISENIISITDRQILLKSINNILSLFDSSHDFRITNRVDIIAPHIINGVIILYNKLSNKYSKQVLDEFLNKDINDIKIIDYLKQNLSSINSEPFKKIFCNFFIEYIKKYIGINCKSIEEININIINYTNFLLTLLKKFDKNIIINDVYSNKIKYRNLTYSLIYILLYNNSSDDNFLLYQLLLLFYKYFIVTKETTDKLLAYFKIICDKLIIDFKTNFNISILETYPSSFLFDQGTRNSTIIKKKKNIFEKFTIFNKSVLDASSTREDYLDNIIRESSDIKKSEVKNLGFQIPVSNTIINELYTTNDNNKELFIHKWYIIENNGIIHYSRIKEVDSKSSIEVENIILPNELTNSITTIDSLIDKEIKSIFPKLDKIKMNTKKYDDYIIKTAPIANNIIKLFGYKRCGDWFQSEIAKYYKLPIITEDFYSTMYALINNVPIIFSDGEDYNEKCEMYLYNFNIKPNIFIDYTTRDLYYRDIDKKINKYKNKQIYYDGTDISTIILKFIMNKYLKYKYKYLKKNNKTINYNILNSVYNKNYSQIYIKYTKYKRKYIKLKN